MTKKNPQEIPANPFVADSRTQDCSTRYQARSTCRTARESREPHDPAEIKWSATNGCPLLYQLLFLGTSRIQKAMEALHPLCVPIPSDNVSSAYNPENRPSTKTIHLIFIVTDLKWISVEFHGGGVFGKDVRLREQRLPNRDIISRDPIQASGVSTVRTNSKFGRS